MTSDVLLAADRGLLTLLGMLDLSAAFDCVDHVILLDRLALTFGIRFVVHDWLTSYLDSRLHRVRYNGSTSIFALVLFGVPQGSVLGPLLFILYSADVFDIADRHGFFIHGYADDLQLYAHCSPEADDIQLLTLRFSGCVDDIRNWMSSNRLRLNASKTEVIWLGSAKRLSCCSFQPIIISGEFVHPVNKVKSLGVLLDSSLTFDSHVTRLVGTCYYHLRQIRNIRHSLTQDSCHALVRALILSRLDYCNGLLGGIPDTLIHKLNAVLRASARLLLRLPRMSHITDVMKSHLHWLDFPSRISFKLCCLAHRCLHNQSPPYLSQSCLPVSSCSGRSQLRSAAAGALVVLRTNTVTIGPRAFAISCPTVWNTLPVDLHDDNLSFYAFRRKLKTFLYTYNRK